MVQRRRVLRHSSLYAARKIVHNKVAIWERIVASGDGDSLASFLQHFGSKEEVSTLLVAAQDCLQPGRHLAPLHGTLQADSNEDKLHCVVPRPLLQVADGLMLPSIVEHCLPTHVALHRMGAEQSFINILIKGECKHEYNCSACFCREKVYWPICDVGSEVQSIALVCSTFRRLVETYRRALLAEAARAYINDNSSSHSMSGAVDIHSDDGDGDADGDYGSRCNLDDDEIYELKRRTRLKENHKMLVSLDLSSRLSPPLSSAGA